MKNITGAMIVDQTTYDTFIEYVVRFLVDGKQDDSIDTRIQADGTLEDLQIKVKDYIQQLNTPPIISEVQTGEVINIV